MCGVSEVRADGATLFAQPVAVVVARERIQKWEGHPQPDFNEVAGWSTAEIRQRLLAQGYTALASTSGVARALQDAAQAGAIAVWTDEHVVTIDASRIDARPG